ncbi:hypothetical protein MKW98_003925 [Papaver atlanticum]|uniref:DOG1 domain-containing protein n=1 Tax=Papaver atlanticum TaxID=357466 RepID=A0AAD4XH38_9MAGN|nr:hypothetical protein MKW98_003925 [Papaver atlanticum]
MASSSDQAHFLECYQNWMIEQQQLLEELLQYTYKRAQQAIDKASSFFLPTWCTSIENSCLWIGGCRPSLLILLVHSLSGSHLESQFTEDLQGVRRGDIGDLSADQLTLVGELQCRTIQEEERLSKRMASIQENIADCRQLTRLANNSDGSDTESHIGQVEQYSLDSHSKDLASILVDSDKLRMNTLRELIGIFTPLQAVEFLIAGKQLHLCMNHWGQRKDHITAMEEHTGEGI